MSEGSKTRGRKPSTKGPNSKKQPQRGLGVEKLERLRLQERWKKITEIPQAVLQPALMNFPDYHLHHHQFHFQTVHQITEPLESVPVQFGAPSYGVTTTATSTSSTTGPVVLNGAAGGRFLAVDRVGLVPKMQFLPSHQDRCDFCFKKTRFNGDDEINNGGLNVKNCLFGRSNSTGQMSTHNVDQEGVEVLAVHRKGNSGGVFLEYEFFPEKNDSTLTEASVSVAGEASNTVDLSLKL